MADQALSVTVPEKILASVIEAQVAAALGDKTELMAAFVRTLLAEKVQANGVRSESSYQNTTPMLTALCARFVREATESAIKGWLAANKDRFEAEVKKALVASSKDIAAGLVANFASGATTYRDGFVVTIARKPDGR